MNRHWRQSFRELFLGVAAFSISLSSVLWFMWAALTNGTLGNPAFYPLPASLRYAACVGILLSFVGVISIGPFWRSAPGILGAVAAAPYWFTALFLFDGRVRGSIFWLGAGLAVFFVFYGFTRLCRFLRAPNVA